MRLDGRLRSTLLVAGATVAWLLATASTALADTASNPEAAEPSNGLILGIVALAALSAVLILARPRRGPR